MRSLIPPLVALSGVVAALTVAIALRWTSRRGRHRSPLTRDLLRSPGHSTREQVENMTLAILTDVVCMTLVASFAALGFAMLQHRQSPEWLYGVVVVFLIAGIGFFTVTVSLRWRDRARCRLALDGEMATGEELNQLMLRGCRVFHDVPAGSFNIDHVVIGAAGVYAVETKARRKRPRGSGREAATVTYDGTVLSFPGWQGREPLAQAKRQAEWLSKWLTSAVGEPVHVKPVLALPGWFVDRKGTGEVLVINPTNATFLAEPRGTRVLGDEMVQRIAHQLEQRCRNVLPRAFRDQRESAPPPLATK